MVEGRGRRTFVHGSTEGKAGDHDGLGGGELDVHLCVFGVSLVSWVVVRWSLVFVCWMGKK